MDSKKINFQGNFQHIYLLSRPVEVCIRGGMSWLTGLEELRSLALQNQGVVFQTEANGVKVTMVYPDAEE